MTLRRAAGLLALAAAVAGPTASCTKDAREAVTNVATLQTGTVSDLYEQRGTGPFREYPVPPDEMVEIAERVLRTKVPAVFVNERTRTVIAKERKGKDADNPDYAPPFRSAVAVFVWPDGPEMRGSRVEFHSIERGPFHRGDIDWDRDLGPLLDAAVRERGSGPVRPLK